MKATLTNYHQSPRKVRLVADLIRGKSVSSALAALSFLPKKSSPAIIKLLESAVSNAKNSGVAAEDLFIKAIAVNKGSVLRRVMPKARGRAASYAKTMSIVTLELGTKQATVNSKQATVKKNAAKKTVKKEAKKPVAKKLSTVN